MDFILPCFFCFVAVLLVKPTYGQEVDYNPKGIGLITPVWFNSDEVYGLSDTLHHLDLYEWPGGNVVAHLLRERDPERPSLLHCFIAKNGVKQLITSRFETFALSGFKDHFLQYYQQYQDFLQIRVNGRVYWLSQEELTKKAFSYPSYLTYLQQMGPSLTPLIGMNINLREEPYAGAAKVVLVKSNDDLKGAHFVLGLVEEVPHSNWAKVEVKKYPSWEAYCQAKQGEVVLYEGWMKVLDNAGFPNVWQYSGACD